ARRDSGFSIFYMGINLGAFGAPLVCGFLAQSEQFRGFLARQGLSPEDSWHWGFGAAAVGMALGLIQYTLGGKRLGGVGLEPARPEDPAAWARQRGQLLRGLAIAGGVLVLFAGLVAAGVIPLTIEQLVKTLGWVLIVFPLAYFAFLLSGKEWTPVERRRLGAVVILFLFASMFWSAFEQAGSTLNLFAERFTRNSLLGFAFPSSWFQSVNSMFIWMLAPVFAWLWIRLGKREPSSPTKFAGGLFFVGLGFLVLAFGAMVSGPAGVRVSPGWLFSV